MNAISISPRDHLDRPLAIVLALVVAVVSLLPQKTWGSIAKPDGTTVVVPNVVGQPSANAEQTLKAAGLTTKSGATKANYVPQIDFKVAVPGTRQGSISDDNQVGAGGRHQQLR